MSYDPSHRKRPPRQARWPQATPPEAWQAYREGDAYPGDVQTGVDNQGSYWATAAAGARSQPAYQGASVGLAADRGYRGYQPPGGPDPFADTAGYAGYDGYDGYGAAGTQGDAAGGYRALGDGYAASQDGYRDADGYAHGGYRPGVNGYDQRGYDQRGYDQRGYGYDEMGAGQDDVAAGYEAAQDGFDGAPVGPVRTATGYAGVQNGDAGARNGYLGTRAGYAPAPDDLTGAPYGYGGPLDDFPEDGFPGAGFAAGDFASPAGYQGRRDYAGPALAGPALTAPDADIYPDSWQAERDRRWAAGRRGLAVGAVTGLLATAAVIGVATLAAAFVGPQASPMTALGNVFIDRTPAALKTLAAGHFGAHDRAVLLLGMYIAIALFAVGTGMLARRAAALGVAGLAAFSLVAAFVVITRPGGRLTDILPSVVGGLAGVAALLWLIRASAPVAPVRTARGGGRRRTR
jgi:hypothetical protein